MSALSAFNTQLVNFFQELSETFPEEREIKMALEAIQGAKKINPRLILDLFYTHVCSELKDAIQRQDIDYVQMYANDKVKTQFNEIMPALSVFNKHWTSMSDANRNAIWKYLKVLCLLCDKARQA